jgi:hypothetical protein
VRRALIVSVVALFVLAMATALLAKPGSGGPRPDKGKHNFTITGDVAGLVPLVEGTIEVTVTNKERFDIVSTRSKFPSVMPALTVAESISW